MTVPIYARADDNILAGAVITSSVAPASSYDLATLDSLRPDRRVRFDVDTVTITWTLATAKQGDVLVIPMHNFTPGSSSVVTLTNGAGFSQVIPRAALRLDGWCPTLAVDLTALAGTRTSNVWNLLIVENAANVVLGGAVAIYGPKRTFAGITGHDGFLWQFATRKTRNTIEARNEYGSLYVQDYQTVGRAIDVTVWAPDPVGVQAFADWFDANAGSVIPSLFWPDPSLVYQRDPYFGRWPATFTTGSVTNKKRSISLTYEEWPKGLVI